MTGLADVDGFKLQVCVWLRFPPLFIQGGGREHRLSYLALIRFWLLIIVDFYSLRRVLCIYGRVIGWMLSIETNTYLMHKNFIG